MHDVGLLLTLTLGEEGLHDIVIGVRRRAGLRNERIPSQQMKRREVPIERFGASVEGESDTPAAGLVGGLSLRANVSWTFASNVFYAACQWAMLLVLARLGNPEMIGQFTLALAVATPIISLGNLQLRNILATDARREYRFGDYLSLRLITVVLGLLVIASIVAVSGYQHTLAVVVMVVGVAKAFEAVSDILHGILQQHERMDRIAGSVMIKGSLSLVALSGTMYLTDSILWGVVSLAVVWGAVLVGYDLPAGRSLLRAVSLGTRTDASLRPQWDRRTLARLVWRSLPLGLVSGLLSLNISIPSYFIAHYLGRYELGIFAAIAYFERAQSIVVNALGASASPRLSKLYAMGNISAFRALLFKMVGAGALMGAGGVLFALTAGRDILTLLYGHEYVRYDVFVWFMVAVGIANVGFFLGWGMTAAGYFRAQLPIFVLVTFVTALASVSLIPTAGLRGAVASLVIGAVVQTLGALGVMVNACKR
jgi:O-antigen/teichoic acid export membrane protein